MSFPWSLEPVTREEYQAARDLLCKAAWAAGLDADHSIYQFEDDGMVSISYTLGRFGVAKSLPVRSVTPEFAAAVAREVQVRIERRRKNP